MSNRADQREFIRRTRERSVMKKGGLLGFREIAGDGLKAIEVASKLVHKRPTGELLPGIVRSTPRRSIQ